MYIYNLLINVRAANKRRNLGNMYLENAYINNTNIINANTTWLIKKKGTSWGIYCYIYKHNHNKRSNDKLKLILTYFFMHNIYL